MGGQYLQVVCRALVKLQLCHGSEMEAEGPLSHRDPGPGVPGCQHILKPCLARKISKALANTSGFFPGVC